MPGPEGERGVQRKACSVKLRGAGCKRGEMQTYHMSASPILKRAAGAVRDNSVDAATDPLDQLAEA